MKMPNTPFSTRLSGSAKETELRIRSIFQWKKKRPPVILFILTVVVLLACFGLVSCEPALPEKLTDNIEQWVADYPWSNTSSNVNQETRWVIEKVRRTDRSYDFDGVRSQVYEVDCRSESGAVELHVTLLIDPNTLEIIDMESRAISGKEEPPQSPPDESDAEEPQPTSEPDKEPDTEPGEQTIGVTLALEGLSEIGKTLASIWSENPGFEYRTVQIPGAAGLCLKEIQDGPLCYFVGTHDGPSLHELGGEYADQLRCAGIVSTVGRGFPKTTDGVSLERFFDGLGVSEYAYYTQDGSGQGWIEFSYGGYCVWIDTNAESADSDHYVESSVMRHEYPLVVVDKEIEIANSAISSEYTSAPNLPDEGSMEAYERQKRLATLDGLDHMPLDELPQDILDNLTLVSESDFSGMYQADWGWRRVYTAPGLEITTTAPSAAYLKWREEVDKGNRELFPTEADFYAYIEGEEGREWLVNVTITDDKFSTLDGLRVGMTRQQAKELGYDLDEGTTTVGPGEKMLNIEVENGVVVRMGTVWMLGRYIGKFFEL